MANERVYTEAQLNEVITGDTSSLSLLEINVLVFHDFSQMKGEYHCQRWFLPFYG